MPQLPEPIDRQMRPSLAPGRRSATLRRVGAGAFLVAFLGLLAVSTAACSAGPTPSGDGRKSIVVTYSIMGAVVKDLVGDAADVTVLMPNGADPHEWAPSAKDIETLLQADLIVENGLNLEGSMGNAFAQAESAGVHRFVATDHITIRHVQAGQGVDATDEDQAAGAPDPHLWMDPLTMRDVVAALAVQLKSDVGLDVSARLVDLKLRLAHLSVDAQSILSVVPAAQRKLVTGHESLGYFADRYGFKLVGAVVPGLSDQAETTSADLAALEGKIRAEGVSAIFTELGTSPATSQAIARDTGARVVELSTHVLPADGSYFTFIRSLAGTIGDALSGPGSVSVGPAPAPRSTLMSFGPLVDPFTQNDLMLRALIAGILVSIACAVVGTFVVLRGLAFIGDALAHGVLPGVAVAMLVGAPGMLGAAVGAVVMIGGVTVVTQRSKLSSDSAIGLLFVGMLALGVVIVSHSASFSGDLTRILFGEILGVSPQDLAGAGSSDAGRGCGFVPLLPAVPAALLRPRAGPGLRLLGAPLPRPDAAARGDDGGRVVHQRGHAACLRHAARAGRHGRAPHEPAAHDDDDGRHRGGGLDVSGPADQLQLRHCRRGNDRSGGHVHLLLRSDGRQRSGGTATAAIVRRLGARVSGGGSPAVGVASAAGSGRVGGRGRGRSRAAGLAVGYDNRAVVEGIDVVVPPRSSLALVGTNGSGKSTLLKSIVGLLKPVHGTLEVFGRPPGASAVRFAYLSQAHAAGFILPLRAIDIVRMARYPNLGLLRRATSEDRDLVMWAMETMGVARLARMPLRALSGGQQQRVYLAQVLARRADLIVLDEPTAGLDAGGRESYLEAFACELERGAALVTATHDIGEAVEYDQVMLLARRVVALGPGAEVLTADRLLDTFGIVIRDPHKEHAGRLVVAERAHGAPQIVDTCASEHRRVRPCVPRGRGCRSRLYRRARNPSSSLAVGMPSRAPL